MKRRGKVVCIDYAFCRSIFGSLATNDDVDTRYYELNKGRCYFFFFLSHRQRMTHKYVSNLKEWINENGRLVNARRRRRRRRIKNAFTWPPRFHRRMNASLERRTLLRFSIVLAFLLQRLFVYGRAKLKRLLRALPRQFYEIFFFVS